MRRRQKIKSNENSLSLDSLMDIVSNIVGMLVIIGVIGSLNLGSKNYMYETPVTQITDKQSVYFECVDDRLIPVTYDSSRYYRPIFSAHKKVLIPIAKNLGESRHEISREGSKFKRFLKDMDPDTQFVALFVRPDGYDAFRVARNIAWELGFDVGWIPKPQYEPIIFSPFGERITKQ